MRFVRTKQTALLITMFAFLQAAHSHSRWLLPSHTSVSGEKPATVTIDSSVSNDIFHPDMALGGKTDRLLVGPIAVINKSSQLMVTSPDGKSAQVELTNLVRKSVASIDLNQSGTYRIFMDTPANDFTSYKNEKGEVKRFSGSKAQARVVLSKSITELKTMRVQVNVVTYVTRNDISENTILPTGKGMELAGIQHPNDLFVGEKAFFKLMINGKAAPEGIEVQAIPHGTRHRNQRGALKSVTDKQGSFSFDWPHAGFYLLEANQIRPVKGEPELDKEMNGMFITIEVNPE